MFMCDQFGRLLTIVKVFEIRSFLFFLYNAYYFELSSNYYQMESDGIITRSRQAITNYLTQGNKRLRDEGDLSLDKRILSWIKEL